MVSDKDTLPYKEKMIVRIDTSYIDKIEYLKMDTSYEVGCQTFEKIDGKTVNQTDTACLRQGLWMEPGSNGNYRTQYYKDNKPADLWMLFNKNKQLLEETEELYLANKSYVVKRIKYANGQPELVVYKPILAFFIRYYIVFIGIWIVSFVVRTCINSEIYNIENETDFPVIGFENRFFNMPDFDDQSGHTFRSAFIIWFFKYKQENHKLVRWSNVLSVISLSALAFLLWGYFNLF